ncbi:MAG: NAD(P)(+) transhydrogenase (Re/Si-specific) subunit beta, partial [Saprospiraceae bacterium]|nr:NAD(P)(+) transhydrogenase (Re/Si-specific) subunit beta [Saprospiraceae bacterium]
MLTFAINLSYLSGAVLFVIGLRMLGSPDTARRGNILAGIGMLLAIVASAVQPLENPNNNYIWILASMGIGGTIGYVSAMKIKMTAMPQMVSIFNGLGGACAVILAFSESLPYYDQASLLNGGQLA